MLQMKISFKVECLGEQTQHQSQAHGKVAIAAMSKFMALESGRTRTLLTNVMITWSIPREAKTFYAILPRPFLQSCPNGHLQAAFLGIRMPGSTLHL